MEDKKKEKKKTLFSLFRKQPSVEEGVGNTGSPQKTDVKRRHTANTIDFDNVVEDSSRLSLVVTLLSGASQETKKKVQIVASQFSLVSMTRIVCERFETSSFASFSFHYEDASSRERFALSTDADFRDCLEESKRKGWSAIRVVVEQKWSPIPTRTVRTHSSDRGSSSRPSSPVVVVSESLAPPPMISADNSEAVEAASKRGSKTIRKGKDKLATVSPRPADSVFSGIHTSQSASSLTDLAKRSPSRSTSPVPNNVVAPSITINVVPAPVALTPVKERKPSDSPGARRRSVSVSDQVDEVSREELLQALKSGSDEVIPPLVGAAIKGKKLTTTIRRPKVAEPTSKGRSLEDFANILSADSTVHESDVVPSVKSQRARRPQSMLLRGVSTFSISSAAPVSKKRAKPRGPLLKDRSLPEFDRSRSAVVPSSAGRASEKSSQLTRAELIAELKRDAVLLQKTFPKEDLTELFKKRSKKFQRELQRAKAQKYLMMMPQFSFAGLVEIARSEGKKISMEPHSPRSSRRESLSEGSTLISRVGSLESLVESCVKILSSSPEDKVAFEAASALCYFGPRLPDGGSKTLVACLKRLYGDKHLQSGVVVFVMLYRDILRHFSKAEKLACGSLLDELSKTMAPDHRAACESSSRTSGLSSGPSGGLSGPSSPFQNRRKVSAQMSARTLDFSEIDIRELADAILALDFENLSRVPIEDFLFKRWEAGKREEKGKASHIFVCVKRWVHLGDWVASEIVCTVSLKQRVTVMRKMVDLASELWMRGDFQSSMSVVSALQSAAIARLRLTWKGLSQACLKKFELLSQLCGPQRHFGLYREEVAKRMALRNSAGTFSFILPFLGLSTQELTSLEESSVDLVDGKLNFEKISLFYKVVGRFYEMIASEHVVMPAVAPNVLSYAAKLTQTLSEEALYSKSLELEERVATDQLTDL